MTNLKTVDLPQMGEGVFEATVVKWLKQVGELVQVGDPLVEIATDKVDTEVSATEEGVLQLHAVSENQVIQVGSPLAVLGDGSEQEARALLASSVKQGVANKTQPAFVADEQVSAVSLRSGAAREQLLGLQGQYAGQVRATPAARALAKSYGVDLAKVNGSNSSGVVSKQDVARLLTFPDSNVAESSLGSCRPNLSEDIFKVETSIDGQGAESLFGVAVERRPMDRVRLKTAEHMIRSVRTSPHVTTHFDVSLERVARHRKDSESQKSSYTAYIIHAAVKALEKFPLVNAAVDGEDILYRECLNIGCAVATDTGLMVPVLRNLHSGISVEQISDQLGELASKARQGQLSPVDLVGATFTITNPGMYGCVLSEPIINQPQVAILSVGKMREALSLDAAKLGRIELEARAFIGLTFDHRVIDGEGGAKFLQSIQNVLEFGDLEKN